MKTNNVFKKCNFSIYDFVKYMKKKTLKPIIKSIKFILVCQIEFNQIIYIFECL